VEGLLGREILGEYSIQQDWQSGIRTHMEARRLEQIDEARGSASPHAVGF
jgi:hypothetical protein